MSDDRGYAVYSKIDLKTKRQQLRVENFHRYFNEILWHLMNYYVFVLVFYASDVITHTDAR